MTEFPADLDHRGHDHQDNAAPFDCRYQDVTCRRCARSYVCTPLDDYYESTTATDGECFDCLIAEEAPHLVGLPYGVVFTAGGADA